MCLSSASLSGILSLTRHRAASSLANFSSLVGIQSLSKEDLPHKFNRRENWNRVVDFPSRNEFSYNKKRKADQEKFDEWYNQEVATKGGRYDFNKEFVDYCRQVSVEAFNTLRNIPRVLFKDVSVLRQCCEKFRKTLMEISGGLCPFNSGPTLASMCNVFWRTRFLSRDTIGIVRKNVQENRQQSAKALKWLEWMAYSRKVQLRTKMNGGEVKIVKFFVDGFDTTNKHAYEFYGCYWHGCTKCTGFTTLLFRQCLRRALLQATSRRQ